MKRLRVLTVCTIVLSIAIFFFKRASNPTTIEVGDGLVIKKEWLKQNNSMLTPKEDCRPANQTFLTFPEWYLVFSPEEQATYFKHHTASSFPFMSHTAQIWESYNIVNNQIKDNFPTNTGYHFMIWVIGSSASVEYIIKSWYETSIGRITDTYETITDEDKFNAKFTQDYVDFIKERPWYEFDFKTRLFSLWTTTSLFGDNVVRKFERKYILTSELFVKFIYGKLIQLGTQTVYNVALPTTAVIIDSLHVNNIPFKIEKRFSDKSVLINLPRYDKFNSSISELAEGGCTFKEIAGNNSVIILTLIVPSQFDWQFENSQVLFTQLVSSDLLLKRIVLAVPVPDLKELILQIHKQNIKIEHVFDY